MLGAMLKRHLRAFSAVKHLFRAFGGDTLEGVRGNTRSRGEPGTSTNDLETAPMRYAEDPTGTTRFHQLPGLKFFSYLTMNTTPSS